MATPRDLATAQHEAAHVVVGVALGLRLRRAALGPYKGDRRVLGWVDFKGRGLDREAWALMYAAGIAWDNGLGYPAVHSSEDRRYCREHCSSSAGVETAIRASAALLAGLGLAHARVTRALLERDLAAVDIEAIAHGDWEP